MITEIGLSNFKSFDELILPISPVTLLTGLNNSGKSSVIQAIRMIWKWVHTGDPSLPSHGSLGEMKSNRAAKSAPMRVTCTLSQRDKIEMNIDFMADFKPQVGPELGTALKLPFLSYLCADRWGPRVLLPMFTASGDLTNVGEHGEYVIDFLSRHERNIVPNSLRHPKAEGDTLEYNVRGWLEEIAPNVDFRHGTDPKRDTSYASVGDFRPTNTGFGLSYTLPIIVSLLGMCAEWDDESSQKMKAERGALVIIENPEAHLHPKGQTSMGRIIALAAACGVQVIVETHSDHLMDGIRIAVKEGTITPEMTVFHYFSLAKEGTTVVVSPKIDQHGKLDYWPEGFFDQTMKNRSILARR